MTNSPPAAAENDAPLPSPVRRNWQWWSLQMMMQGLFVPWIGYRARGVEHLPAESGALLLINHRSFLDPLLAGLAMNRPVSYLARHNLFDVPGFGPLFRKNYVVPINRNAAGSASIREIVRRLQHGFLVGMFPEGTRQTGPEVIGRLKPGFISLLRRSNAPVIPVGISGPSSVMHKGSLLIRPGVVRVVIGRPVDAQQLSELLPRGREQELLALITNEMADALQTARRWLSQSDSLPSGRG